MLVGEQTKNGAFFVVVSFGGRALFSFFFMSSLEASLVSLCVCVCPCAINTTRQQRHTLTQRTLAPSALLWSFIFSAAGHFERSFEFLVGVRTNPICFLVVVVVVLLGQENEGDKRVSLADV